MSDGSQQVLGQLVDLGKVDAKIANIIAEKERLNSQLIERITTLRAAKSSADSALKVFQENEAKLRKDEHYVRDEQAKLTDRRKALSNLNNYKLQLAAEKEIDAAASQLGAHEEEIILLMDKVEDLKVKSQELKVLFDSMRTEVEAFEKDVNETMAALEARMKDALSERAEASKGIPPRSLSTYERIKEKYPQDAIVPLDGMACSGCFLGLGAQVKINIQKGTELVRCKGCGRILFIGREEVS